MIAITTLLEPHSVIEPIVNFVYNIVVSKVALVEGGILELLKHTLINGASIDPAQEALPFLIYLAQFFPFPSLGL